MKTYISSLILFVTLMQYSYTQEPNINLYLPLNTGNIWVYNWIYMGNPVTGGTSRSIVTSDTIINTRKYYKCSLPVIGLQYLRADSVSGNIYVYNPSGGCSYHPEETLIDSLRSKMNDTVSFCDSVYRKCIDTGFVTLFGNQYQKKDFQPLFELTASSRHYAKNLGIYFLNMGDPYITMFTLKGCVINGIVFGDTSLPVGLQNINSEIPDKFILSQNYPNPFNPVTKIKFSLPSPRWTSGQAPSKGGAMDVKLVVYDVLGREVANLIPPLWGGKEGLSPGTYEVEWDGTNYPSGVYFYKLITADYTETKKMVLTK